MISKQRLEEIRVRQKKHDEAPPHVNDFAASWQDVGDLCDEVEFLGKMVHDLQEESTAYNLGNEAGLADGKVHWFNKGVGNGVTAQKSEDIRRLQELRRDLQYSMNFTTGRMDVVVNYALALLEEVTASIMAYRMPILSNAGTIPNVIDPYAHTTVDGSSDEGSWGHAVDPSGGNSWTSQSREHRLEQVSEAMQAGIITPQQAMDMIAQPPPQLVQPQVTNPAPLPARPLRSGHISQAILDDLEGGK